MNIHVLLHEHFDESLVYMASKTGMSYCDIIYPPCSSAAWDATKCNFVKANQTVEEFETLTQLARETGEADFYSAVLPKAQSNILDPHIVKLTETFRELQKQALEKCLAQGLSKTIESMRQSKLVRASKGNFYYMHERTNVLDPLHVCMGEVCRNLL